LSSLFLGVPCAETVSTLTGITNQLLATLATKIIDHLLTERRLRYIPGTELAMIYDALSEVDLAFEWLNRALPGRSMNRQCLAIGNRPSNSVLNGDSIRARIEDGYRPYDLAAPS